MNLRQLPNSMVDLCKLCQSTVGPMGSWTFGGKDSTALTMLLLETMEKVPPPIRNKKKVFVTCVNTLVEAPPVIEHVHAFIDELRNTYRIEGYQ